MLIIFLRAFILFGILLVVIRLMGKRQLGEMEPFELVITLVISELACIPISDRAVPITYGIVAILTMFVIHQAVLLFSRIPRVQKALSGKPVLVVNKNGIDAHALKKLNMQVNDLLQALRVANCFSLEEVHYAIMETSGQLTVVVNKEMSDKQQTLPVPVILDGKWDDDDISRNGIDKSRVETLLDGKGLRVKDVLVMTVDCNNRMVFQSVKGSIQFEDIDGGLLLNE